jgi:kynurenine formamidase
MERRELLQGAMGLATLAALAGCAASPAKERSAAPGPAQFTRLVDLSHVVRTDIPYLPHEPLTSFERDAHGQAHAITLGLRSGTSLRIVAPETANHTLEQLSPRDLLLPLYCLDIRDLVQEQTDFRLAAAAIEDWERKHQPIAPGAAVLFATGWDMRWGDANAYLNLDAQYNPVMPGLAPAAYQLLHDRQVRAIGSDTMVVQPQPTAQPWLLLENLTSLEQLPPTGATLFLGPLKLQATSAGPVRAIALVNSE